jgi:hypothetical protein
MPEDKKQAILDQEQYERNVEESKRLIAIQ